MRFLAIVPEAFGGFGGIAVYNRDFLTALSELPLCEKVTVLPRLIRHAGATLPLRIELLEKAANNRVRYVCELARVLIKRDPYDVVLCGHINLLPLAVDRKSPVGSKASPINLWDRRVESHRQATKRSLSDVRGFSHFDQPNHQTTVPVLGLSRRQSGPFVAERNSYGRIWGRRKA